MAIIYLQFTREQICSVFENPYRDYNHPWPNGTIRKISRTTPIISTTLTSIYTTRMIQWIFGQQYMYVHYSLTAILTLWNEKLSACNNWAFCFGNYHIFLWVKSDSILRLSRFDSRNATDSTFFFFFGDEQRMDERHRMNWMNWILLHKCCLNFFQFVFSFSLVLLVSALPEETATMKKR